MRIFIGHNGHDARSRAFVAANQDNPAIEDVLDYLYEAGPFTNYQGFPFVGVIMDDGSQRTFFNPASWAEVEAWMGSLTHPPKVEFTRLEFLKLFTDAELVALKAVENSDPVVGVFWEQYRTAETIRLDDERTVNGLTYLASQGYITPERKAAILGL